MSETNQRLITFITRSNWLLLLVSGIAGVLFTSPRFASGVILGGLIVTVNFHLLARTLKKSFRFPHTVSTNSVLLKYYIRFILSGVLIFLLIVKHMVEPVGLCIGLSVVVVSITLGGLMEIRILFTKEAA